VDEQQSVGPPFRCGYVTIVGAPNAGKSTLMNCLIGQKISIVTPKPQTTRHAIIGILSTNEAQVIFLDTPGLITPKYKLQSLMMKSAASAVADADVLLFMIDAAEPASGGEEAWTSFSAAAGERRIPRFLVLNKADLVEKRSLLPIIERWAAKQAFDEIFPISALHADGTAELLKAIVARLPEHPPYYPLDIASERDQRFFVAEIIREKIFMACHEEVPYASTVEIGEFKEREAGKWYIAADIFVERESQKGILIGKKGSMLKSIGQRARSEIERTLGHPVFLELRVKVSDKWRDDEHSLKQFGYTP